MILNKQVGVFLNLVHNRTKQYITGIFQQHGFNITPEQFLVMDALWDNGVMSQQELADNIMKDKNSIVKLIDGLEKKDLVRRVADKTDRRKNMIELTPYALSIKDDVTEVALESINHVTKDIPTNELRIFIQVLGKMATNMNEDTDLQVLAGNTPTQPEEAPIPNHPAEHTTEAEPAYATPEHPQDSPTTLF